MQRLGRLFAAGILGIFALMIVWGLIEPYFLDVERYTVALPNLPPSWNGAEIAVIGDFQLGMWLTNESTVRRAVAHLVEERPDVVLIAGDFLKVAVEPDGVREQGSCRTYDERPATWFHRDHVPHWSTLWTRRLAMPTQRTHGGDAGRGIRGSVW